MRPGIQRRVGREGKGEAVMPMRVVHVLDKQLHTSLGAAVRPPAQVAGLA